MHLIVEQDISASVLPVRRIRYPLGTDPATGKRRISTVTIKGDRRAAEKELRARLKAIDDNAHVAPDKITIGAWIELWLPAIEVDPRTAERYGQLLRLHVVPTLGAKRLQALRASDLDTLYTSLRGKISDQIRHHVHVVLGTCLRAAVRKDMLVRNPVANATPPRVERKVEGEGVGTALSKERLKASRCLSWASAFAFRHRRDRQRRAS